MKNEGKGTAGPPGKAQRTVEPTVELDGAGSHRSFEGERGDRPLPDRHKPGKVVRPAKGELSPRD